MSIFNSTRSVSPTACCEFQGSIGPYSARCGLHFFDPFIYLEGLQKILVGGWPTPLKNDGVKVGRDDEIPNFFIWKNKKFMFQTTKQDSSYSSDMALTCSDYFLRLPFWLSWLKNPEQRNISLGSGLDFRFLRCFDQFFHFKFNKASSVAVAKSNVWATTWQEFTNLLNKASSRDTDYNPNLTILPGFGLTVALGPKNPSMHLEKRLHLTKSIFDRLKLGWPSSVPRPMFIGKMIIKPWSTTGVLGG